MNFCLFDDDDLPPSGPQPLVPGATGATLLRGFALPQISSLLAAIDDVLKAAPLRHMATPGGLRMSVAMSNCGPLGWVTDSRGYRYARQDPASGLPWPAMPAVFQELAREAAQAAGFPGFVPDACLINRYAPGARMALHQDKDESDFAAPIVSVSLGLPATFLFGGAARADKAARIALFHGDVVVWGGADRLRYHGVAPLKDGQHALLGAQRINLTFRKAR
ncbi:MULTISPECIES: DNA oxidative demethylase AlkB [unclassified Janthinobacterium]|uniref:DNA oxidative demethylase AlkB n=1 Tax=unclassified Janthinobacterium TaxID=2610881 RepID=UPI001614851E|nr:MULTISPECIES: DNA oxidative demethylase AlkB [unclassified Janthinobacterium]MBB5369986.1 alkylated DNA repair protein (DNA oxidative demethylase) [Janthinobacterium sp. K2C7]MBB5382792.1 alkylated DNA repair protein (DNA oxidative demethylase) [Janthinobacterium sp. K2Li3]MBB5384777.1 alkylated DNA repair protein (DNA oxidative demethylase) [Janthinobacterium sp. K2E3]